MMDLAAFARAMALCSPTFALLFGVWSVNRIPLRRDHRAPRFAGAALMMLLAAGVILILPEAHPRAMEMRMAYYYAVYLAIGGTLLLCCEASVYEAAFVMGVGQLWQHLLYSLSALLFTALKMAGHPVNVTSAPVTVGVFLFYAAAYTIMHLTLKAHFRNNISLRGNGEILVACLLLPIPLMVLDQLINRAPQQPEILLYYRIHSCLICLTAYFMLMSIQHTKVAKLEIDRVKQASLRQKERYEIKKEVIDRVNIRAHDLKKQLSRLESAGGRLDPGALEAIRRELGEYDHLADTGNEELDLILYDAAERCAQAGIRFTWLIDGRAIDFMAPLDLYAVFGNLLDNAIAAASGVPEAGERVISLNMTRSGDLLYFHMYNTFAAQLTFEDGLPRTTQKDIENHGFGMKSVRASLKKYGGELLISAEGGVFNVNFMMRAR